MQDFLKEFRHVFSFDPISNKHSQNGFSIQPQHWNLHEHASLRQGTLITVNMASEFLIHLITHYFPPDICLKKELDMR